MFLPKPFIALLFLVALVSTVCVLYLLAQRPSLLHRPPVASTTIFVDQSVSPSTLPSPTRAVLSEFVADSSWKTATSSALNISLDYPRNWHVVASDSASLIVYSPAIPRVPYIAITREKKRSFKEDTLSQFISLQEQRYKEQGYALARSQNFSIAGYIGNERFYTQHDTHIREIVFATQHYFYIIVITPQLEDRNNIVDDILRSVRVF